MRFLLVPLLLACCSACQSRQSEPALAPTPTPAKSEVTKPTRVHVSEGEDLADLVHRIGQSVGRTILVDPRVESSVTPHISGLAWREAIEVLAKASDCELEERQDGVIVLVPAKSPRTE